jgi:hypothetical protein
MADTSSPRASEQPRLSKRTRPVEPSSRRLRSTRNPDATTSGPNSAPASDPVTPPFFANPDSTQPQPISPAPNSVPSKADRTSSPPDLPADPIEDPLLPSEDPSDKAPSSVLTEAFSANAPSSDPADPNSSPDDSEPDSSFRPSSSDSGSSSQSSSSDDYDDDDDASTDGISSLEIFDGEPNAPREATPDSLPSLRTVSPSSSSSESSGIALFITPMESAPVIAKEGKIPYIGDGKITQEVIGKFSSLALAFQTEINCSDSTLIAKLSSKFSFNRDMRSFWQTDGSSLKDASYADFLTALRGTLFGTDWALDVWRKLDSISQSGNEAVTTFIENAVELNSVLEGTSYVLDESALRATILRGLTTEMRTASHAKPGRLHKARFADWKVELTRIKLEVAERRSQIQFAVNQALAQQSAARQTSTRSSKRSFQSSGLSEPSRNANVSHSSTPGGSKDTSRLGRLSDDEKTLLHSNSGCTKCRRAFTDCTSENCEDLVYGSTREKLFPMSAPITQKDINDAKLGKGRCAPRRNKSAGSSKATAAVVDSTDLSSVAAVREYSNVSAVLDVSPNSSFDSDVSPHTVASVPPSTPHTATPSSRSSSPCPLTESHLVWNAVVSHARTADAIPVETLIDTGSFIVLISSQTVHRCGLKSWPLHTPITTVAAFDKIPRTHSSFVRLKLHDPSFAWSARSVKALITDNLCHDVVLGLPFICYNRLIIDAYRRRIVDETSGFDILHPSVVPPPPICTPLKELYQSVMSSRKAVVKEINASFVDKKTCLDSENSAAEYCPIGAIREHVEQLARREQLERLGAAFVEKYADVFSPLPQVHRLPDTTLCHIQLKEVPRPFKPKVYTCPRKYRGPWKTLIDEHLEAGRIRASDSPYASPSFIIPKADPTAAPRWVNDYRALNALTITDRFPLPRVEEVLADAAKGSIWSKMDMTNSFFHTRMNPEHVKFTAVSTPFGLYEWLVMPMGLKNAPPIHQRRVTMALRQFIGVFCHVYMDDIIVWSNSIEEHTKHITLIMEALSKDALHLNKKKCLYYQDSIEFLGHRVSTRGIEACSSKCERIINWPRPQTAGDVRSFLGLVRYIATFLPNLAEHTSILNPLTSKEYNKSLPEWTEQFQNAFDAIKALVVSRECLTTIDHEAPGDNRIFVTTDASDRRTGAVLSFGPTWESARPVAFDSMQLSAPQRNYPVHEKELLAIVRALEKWRNELLGYPVTVYTDHRTLEYFNTQQHLSRRQA